MAHFEKHFTVEEANALLPEVQELLGNLQAIRDHLTISYQEAQPVLQAVEQNGGGREANAYLTDIHLLNERLLRLASLGVQLKDLDRGLVDFPAWREEREVFLCWHLGEDRVRYWHDLESGFAGRQPI